MFTLALVVKVRTTGVSGVTKEEYSSEMLRNILMFSVIFVHLFEHQH